MRLVSVAHPRDVPRASYSPTCVGGSSARCRLVCRRRLRVAAIRERPSKDLLIRAVPPSTLNTSHQRSHPYGWVLRKSSMFAYRLLGAREVAQER